MPKITIDLSRLPEATNKVYYPFYFDRHRYNVFCGGAGSGKSVFVAQKRITLTASQPGHKFGIFRKVARTLRPSVFQQYLDVINGWGWRDYFKVNTSNMTMTFIPNGNQLLFLGLDDPEKLKSIPGLTGAHVEEATECTEEDLDQIDLRLRGQSPHHKQIDLTFNPISHLHWLKRRFFDTPQHGLTRALRTTYRDNRFLDAEYIQRLQLLAEQNPNLHRIYAEGEWGVLKGLIYDPPLIDEWPDTSTFTETIFGLDFGFNHAMALTRCDLIEDTDAFLSEEIYQRGMTVAQLIEKLPSIIPDPSTPIYCDSSRPDSIEEICQAGYNALPADKGKGSVQAGIDLCKSIRLHSKPENVNLNAEFGTYSWREDKYGNCLDEPVKFNDDGMDSFRYPLFTHLKGARSSFSVSSL